MNFYAPKNFSVHPNIHLSPEQGEQGEKRSVLTLSMLKSLSQNERVFRFGGN